MLKYDVTKFGFMTCYNDTDIIFLPLWLGNKICEKFILKCDFFLHFHMCYCKLYFCTGTQLILEGQAVRYWEVLFQKWPVWDSNPGPLVWHRTVSTTVLISFLCKTKPLDLPRSDSISHLIHQCFISCLLLYYFV